MNKVKIQHLHRCLNCFWNNNVIVEWHDEDIISECAICKNKTVGKMASFIEIKNTK